MTVKRSSLLLAHSVLPCTACNNKKKWGSFFKNSVIEARRFPRTFVSEKTPLHSTFLCLAVFLMRPKKHSWNMKVFINEASMLKSGSMFRERGLVGLKTWAHLLQPIRRYKNQLMKTLIKKHMVKHASFREVHPSTYKNRCFFLYLSCTYLVLFTSKLFFVSEFVWPFSLSCLNLSPPKNFGTNTHVMNVLRVSPLSRCIRL